MEMRDITQQTIGVITEHVSAERIQDFNNQLGEIARKTHGELVKQGICFGKALDCMDSVRKFIGTPEHILGSTATKHGEIAEQVEVGLHNAKNILHRLPETGIIDSNIVARTGPIDYIIDNVNIQSKFCNGEINTLKAVLEHFEKYPDWISGQEGQYVIPKDQFETIIKLLNGETTGNSLRYDDKVLYFVSKIQEKAGKPFVDIVRPASVNYADVQFGKINSTLDIKTDELKAENENIRRNIKTNAAEQKEQVVETHKPTLGEAGKATLYSAGVAFGITFAAKIWEKKNQGKDLSKFTKDDFKEIGLYSAKAAGKGGLSGLAIYSLTNYAKCNAPVASAIVSAAFGVASLADDYINHRITYEEFKESGTIVCADAAVAGIGAVLGQVVIPIPYIGAVIGSVAANTFWKLLKEHEGIGKYIDLDKLKAEIKADFEKVNAEAQKYIKKIEEHYAKIGGLINYAFDKEVNIQIRFEYSKQLAIACGVENPLETKEDIDDYFLK